MKVRIVSLFFFICSNLFGYVLQRDSVGNFVKWSESSSSVSIYIDSSNSSISSSSDVTNIITNSISTWNNNSQFDLIARSGNGQEDGRNDVYFDSSDSVFAGGAVLAVTKTYYSESKGKIIEADIVIRDDGMISSTRGNTNYLGDIVTHEVGHFLGLDHSEVIFSSMFYSSVKGQDTLHTDDIAGTSALYGASNSGSISGNVAGGDSVISVLGAEINAISLNSGKVIASSFSDESGNFSISNLPLDDVYYLYIKPPKKKSSLSEYFSEAQTDFCAGGSSYRGSFYESCRKSERGKPQGIKLNSSQSSYSTGTISIKCSLDVSPEYFSMRSTPPMILNNNTIYPGDMVTGFFSTQDISSNEQDHFEIDLSNYTVLSGNYYLEAKLISHDLYSPVQFDLEIANVDSSTNYTYTINSDGNPDMNILARFPMSLNQTKNVFDIKIKPTDFDTFLSTLYGYVSEDFFPSGSYFKDDHRFYALMVSVTEKVNGKYELRGHKNYYLGDNLTCMDAQSTYKISGSTLANSISSGTKKLKRDQDGAFACGSVDMDGSGGSGNGSILSLLVGILGALLLSFSSSRKNTVF